MIRSSFVHSITYPWIHKVALITLGMKYKGSLITNAVAVTNSIDSTIIFRIKYHIFTTWTTIASTVTLPSHSVIAEQTEGVFREIWTETRSKSDQKYIIERKFNIFEFVKSVISIPNRFWTTSMHYLPLGWLKRMMRLTKSLVLAG